jgi:transcriptional regulator with XRE-family HTH domain
MRPISHIRTSVFGLTQLEFAELAGTTQATVSRWEAGEFSPSSDNLKRIREAALARNIEWDDSWFFDAPQAAQ